MLRPDSFPHYSRREFARRTISSAALLGAPQAALLSRFPAVSRAESESSPGNVQFSPDIEPLVRLLEDTERDQLLEVVADRVRNGLSYQEVLAALQLAGVRNVEPRPSVGFKFHAVLVVNSAHLASLASPDEERWLPIFWALDYFKSSQSRDVREGNWTMAPVNEDQVPPSQRARRMFVDAMEKWDESQADAAVAGLARTAGAQQIFDLLCRYGARDFRSIGHKAIFVANSWRTLQSIGWRHAEPVLRSLAYALLNHEGENPAERDAEADRPWRENLPLAATIRADWRDGKNDSAMAVDLLETLRSGTPRDASQKVAQILNSGGSPQAIWDGLFLNASELLVRQPGIIGLHTLTTTNALHFAYQHTGHDETRRLMMLQNAAFLPMFRDRMPGRGSVGDQRLDQIEPSGAGVSTGDDVSSIFAHARGNRDAAVSEALGYLKAGNDPQALIDMARLLVFFKGDDSHDYKFSSAVLEDFYHVSPQWRDHLLAASMVQLRGAEERDNPLVGRIRDVLTA